MKRKKKSFDYKILPDGKKALNTEVINYDFLGQKTSVGTYVGYAVWIIVIILFSTYFNPACYLCLIGYPFIIYKEIKKEGHTRFFLNIAFCGEVEKAVNKIGDLLPSVLCENLKTAYSHYVVLVNEENEETEQKIRDCDTFFDENEQLLLDMIQEYANTLEV